MYPENQMDLQGIMLSEKEKQHKMLHIIVSLLYRNDKIIEMQDESVIARG